MNYIKGEKVVNNKTAEIVTIVKPALTNNGECVNYLVECANGCNIIVNAEDLKPYVEECKKPEASVRDHNVGKSDYAQHKIQPWDIWIEYKLNPFDADIVKRVLRHKKGESRRLDYEKIIHICQERIRQIDNNIEIE